MNTDRKIFKKRFFPQRDTTEAMKLIRSFVEDKLNEDQILEELHKVYFPSDLNLKYKKEILGKLKSKEYTEEEGERKLHWFFRLPYTYIEKTNKSTEIPTITLNIQNN